MYLERERERALRLFAEYRYFFSPHVFIRNPSGIPYKEVYSTEHPSNSCLAFLAFQAGLKKIPARVHNIPLEESQHFLDLVGRSKGLESARLGRVRDYKNLGALRKTLGINKIG